MANVLNEQKREQVVALGRLGWPLRRIEEATGGRPLGDGERVSEGRGDRDPPAAALGPAPAAVKAGQQGVHDPALPAWPPRPGRSPRASACEPYREWIERAVVTGRDAVAIWRDLVDDHGFPARYASVKRFVRQLRAERRWSAARHTR